MPKYVRLSFIVGSKIYIHFFYSFFFFFFFLSYLQQIERYLIHRACLFTDHEQITTTYFLFLKKYWEKYLRFLKTLVFYPEWNWIYKSLSKTSTFMVIYLSIHNFNHFISNNVPHLNMKISNLSNIKITL